MKEQEYAEYLYNKFYDNAIDNSMFNSKENAILCVEEIIKEFTERYSNSDYWKFEETVIYKFYINVIEKIKEL